MKNIHILPTDKPSRLYEYNNKLFIGEFGYNLNRNIYITNDEEIKEGDWGFDGLHIFKCLKPFIANETTSGKNIPCFYIELDGKSNTFHETSYIKKIILTTDQALIKDGVQAIPDDFLEWFVKNPSCEEVEVDKQKEILGEVAGTTYIDFNYKIIIPKKEPKKEYQTCKCGSNWFNTTVTDKPFCFKCGESVKEDFKPTEETCTCTDECLGYLTKTCKGIEETALRLYPNRESFLDRFQDIEREAFIKGYKLAKERSYNEEEVIEILNQFDYSFDSIRDTIPQWFEQIKKK